ncbi:10582_t:CDS:2 [Acaulospora morrowiae]|uniref:10582_t:CDS:1 n=1 Tax=Acaulospora morrowiae TaxID=94023 RepID=A0A9N8W545_9GLOM|nr:10582_t:CDS:2 [Acaulospora morrowiae]
MGEKLPLEELSKTGFKILEIKVDSPFITGNLKSIFHYLFFKRHESRGSKDSPTKVPPERTLFISNLPTDATEEHVRIIFEEFGEIEGVIFHGVPDREEFLIDENNDFDKKDPGIISSENKGKKLRKRRNLRPRIGTAEKNKLLIREVFGLRTFLIPGSSAYVIFESSEGLNNALNMRQKMRLWNAKHSVLSLGLDKWIEEYKALRRDPNDLQREVDEYMRKFEEAEQKRRQELEAKHNQPDEEGFITVTRTGRRNVNTDGTITVTAAKPEEVKGLKPKNKELVDFYRFQTRETKRNRLVDLRKKFEEDKQKIAKLKANRRFRPY